MNTKKLMFKLIAVVLGSISVGWGFAWLYVGIHITTSVPYFAYAVIYVLLGLMFISSLWAEVCELDITS